MQSQCTDGFDANCAARRMCLFRLKLKYFNFGKKFARLPIAKANLTAAAALVALEETVIHTSSVKVSELCEPTGDVMY